MLVNTKCFSHPQGAELNLGTLCVSFYRIRKIVSFFLRAGSNSKITLIKAKRAVINHEKNNCDINGYRWWRLRYGKVAWKCWKPSSVKLLFFYMGLYLSWTFKIIHTTTGLGGNSSWGTIVFGQIIYREVILNGRTNDQIIPRGEEFHKWF